MTTLFLIILIIGLLFFLVLQFIAISDNKKKKEEKKRREELRKQRITNQPAHPRNASVNNTVEPSTYSFDKSHFADYKKINVAIKGLAYRSNIEIRRAKRLFIGEKVFLNRDFNNQYDKNATEVRTSDNVFIGYVDADYSQSVAMRIREDFDIQCFISKITMDVIPFVYMDIFYKDTFDRQKENTHEAVISKKYLEYDLDKLLTLKWDIDRFNINIEDNIYEEVEERIHELFDDHIREKIKHYSYARLELFLKTKEADDISTELRNEIELKLRGESDINKLERECSGIRSKIIRLKKKGDLSEMDTLEKELEEKHTKISTLKLSEKQSKGLVLPEKLDDLLKMQDNWRSKILKAENVLSFQSETKKGKEPNPIPEGYKRTKLENRVTLLKEQKAKIDSKIEKLS